MDIICYKEIGITFQDFINDIDFKLNRSVKLKNTKIFENLSFEFFKSINNLILKYQKDFKSINQCKRLKEIIENIFK